jgi:quercetin dioxygenase-like cupin family protein
MSNLPSSTSLRKGEDFGRLTELVDYQSGSVVSRTLMKSDGGNLTLFAFDKGEGLSEHTTPHDALVWVAEGRVTINIDKNDYSLEIGDFIRLPAQVPHAVHALEKMKMALIMFFD